MNIDEALFWEHINGPEFQNDADWGKWGLLFPQDEKQWPFIFIWIKAVLYEYGKITLRFTVDKYPEQAPSAYPWNIEEQCILIPAKWPKGRDDIKIVFNPVWCLQNGGLYCPLDRKALKGHDRWKNEAPSLYWKSSFTICNYLNFIYHLLN